jgi:hypothetical protein
MTLINKNRIIVSSFTFLGMILLLVFFTLSANAQLMPGDALVIDQTAGTDFLGALFRVDLTTGDRTLISDFGNAAQGSLGLNPNGVTLFTIPPPNYPHQRPHTLRMGTYSNGWSIGNSRIYSY